MFDICSCLQFPCWDRQEFCDWRGRDVSLFWGSLAILEFVVRSSGGVHVKDGDVILLLFSKQNENKPFQLIVFAP